MKPKYIVISIISLLMIAACSTETGRQLRHADSVMEERPDSAMSILQGIDRQTLKPSELPYYALLYTQAQVKTDVPLASDSLISIAYAKYGADTRGDRGIRSNFYTGEVFFRGQVDYSMDYVFNVLAEMVNRDVQGWRPDGGFGYPFSDKGIDGRRYTLTVSEVLQYPVVSMIAHLPRKVNLYAISQPYFEHMVSILSQDYEQAALQGNLLSLGLMEPSKIYTNIDSGAGILGCYNLSTFKIDLLELTGGWPSSGSTE